MMKRKATTLIEIVLYFTLLAIFMAVAFSFAFQIATVSEISSRLNELETQSQFIQEKIKTTIQMADSVNSDGSTFDSDAGVLSLNMSEPALSPTAFSLVNGEIRIQEGSGAATALHSSFVELSSLRFHRITYPKTPDQIQVDAVLTMPSDLANTDAEINLHFTISLRL